MRAFYLVLVFLNGEVLDLVPFTIVMRHGEEFEDAQGYLDWSAFALSFLADYETAVYALFKGHRSGPCPHRGLREPCISSARGYATSPVP